MDTKGVFSITVLKVFASNIEFSFLSLKVDKRPYHDLRLALKKEAFNATSSLWITHPYRQIRTQKKPSLFPKSKT